MNADALHDFGGGLSRRREQLRDRVLRRWLVQLVYNWGSIGYLGIQLGHDGAAYDFVAWFTPSSASAHRDVSKPRIQHYDVQHVATQSRALAKASLGCVVGLRGMHQKLA